MRKQKNYPVIRSGNTFLVPAAVGGKSLGDALKVNLLVDTGASFTILPVEVVKKLGYDTSHPVRMARLAAASGIIDGEIYFRETKAGKV